MWARLLVGLLRLAHLGISFVVSAVMAFRMLPDSLYSLDKFSPAVLSAASVSSSRSERNAVPTVFSASESTLAQKFKLGTSPFGMPLIPAASEKKIQLYSMDYYLTCALGGVLSCGLTHTAVTPLDVVKCNMQIDPTKYTSIGSGFSITMKEGGMGGLVRGWLPTLFGYSVQGAGKFGLYEYFKK